MRLTATRPRTRLRLLSRLLAQRAEFWASCKKSSSAIRGGQAGIVGRHVQHSQPMPASQGAREGGWRGCVLPRNRSNRNRLLQPTHPPTHPAAGCPCSHPPATGSQRHRPLGTWRPAAEQQGRTLGGSNGSSVGFTCSCHHAASNWRLHEGPMEPSAMPTLTRTSIVARSRALVSRSPRCCTCNVVSMAAGQRRITSGKGQPDGTHRAPNDAHSKQSRANLSAGATWAAECRCTITAHLDCKPLAIVVYRLVHLR